MQTEPGSSGAAVTSIVERAATRNGTFQLRRHWKVGQARAAAVIVHGIGEHSARYLHLGEFLAERGIDVVAFDNQGFGHSGGRRGDIDSFDTYLDDIEDLVIDRRGLGIPVVVFGHSLGGLMVASYLVEGRTGPDLAVLSAPALGASVPRWQRMAAPVMGRLAPSLFVPSRPTPGILSSDPRVEEAYEADPLIVRGATARLGLEIFNRMKLTRGRLDRLTVPTYVLHGDADRLVPQRWTASLAEHDAVTYRSWPGLRHECLNEPQSPQVMAELVQWLNERLPSVLAQTG